MAEIDLGRALQIGNRAPFLRKFDAHAQGVICIDISHEPPIRQFRCLGFLAESRERDEDESYGD